MSKKKHPEHVNHERWLVSYADFITLLFAFFVVLFASGQTSKRKQVLLAQSMQSAFTHNGIFEPHSRTPPIADDTNAIQNAVPLPVALPLPSLAEPDAARFKRTAERIGAVVKAQIDKKQMAEGTIHVRSSPDGLVISLREAGFFASGSAEVREESLPALRAIATALPEQTMRIEGHTDNVPIHTTQFASNWELSTARAATIARLLISWNTADPKLVSAVGYAEFRPLAENNTDAGRAQNRRVDLVLVKMTLPAPSSAGTGTTPALPIPLR